MTLDAQQVRHTLNDIRYLPGWTFHVYDDPYEGLHLRIAATVTDSYHPDATVDLDINTPLPPFDTPAELIRWLDWRLVRIAVHEHREFLTYQGQRVSDPHIDTADAVRRRNEGAPPCP